MDVIPISSIPALSSATRPAIEALVEATAAPKPSQHPAPLMTVTEALQRIKLAAVEALLTFNEEPLKSGVAGERVASPSPTIMGGSSQSVSLEAKTGLEASAAHRTQFAQQVSTSSNSLALVPIARGVSEAYQLAPQTLPPGWFSLAVPPPSFHLALAVLSKWQARRNKAAAKQKRSVRQIKPRHRKA